jgi:hypothetical protein|tara:strand:+ start:550 stop:873 length:324 start_codon:yes stop_codon:yes gene_type:complete
MYVRSVVAVNGMLTASFATVAKNGLVTTFRNGVQIANKRSGLWRRTMGTDDYQGVECDQCGEICWEHTSYFGDIRCDECAYEDQTYRREVLGEETNYRAVPASIAEQ